MSWFPLAVCGGLWGPGRSPLVLRIRKDQFALFSAHQSSGFELRLAEFLQAQFADAAQIPLLTLRPEVAAQIERAQGYGVKSEQDIADYVVTAWLLGIDFDTRFPAANEVLTADLPGEMKAQFLEEWTKEMFEKLKERD